MHSKKGSTDGLCHRLAFLRVRASLQYHCSEGNEATGRVSGIQRFPGTDPLHVLLQLTCIQEDEMTSIASLLATLLSQSTAIQPLISSKTRYIRWRSSRSNVYSTSASHYFHITTHSHKYHEYQDDHQSTFRQVRRRLFLAYPAAVGSCDPCVEYHSAATGSLKSWAERRKHPVKPSTFWVEGARGRHGQVERSG